MSGPPLGPGGEFDRIRSILRDPPALPADVRVGPGDDAAVIAPDLVISTDLAVEGVHFRLDWVTPREAGVRAAAAALSDLAAMAARPLGLLASVAAAGDGSDAALELMAGVRGEAEAHGGLLLGGDLTRSSGPLLVDVVALGRSDRPLLRSGAAPGDELWVTGTLGGASAAVALWQKGIEPPHALRHAFTHPEPRLEPARWLVTEAGAKAGLDLSDGIAGDAAHLAAASQVGVELRADAIPLHPALAGHGRPHGLDPMELALHGGEDYELLVAIAPGGLTPAGVEEFARRFDLRLTRVGAATAGGGVSLVPPGGSEARPLLRGGYDHFEEEGRR